MWLGMAELTEPNTACSVGRLNIGGTLFQNVQGMQRWGNDAVTYTFLHLVLPQPRSCYHLLLFSITKSRLTTFSSVNGTATAFAAIIRWLHLPWYRRTQTLSSGITWIPYWTGSAPDINSASFNMSSTLTIQLRNLGWCHIKQCHYCRYKRC